MAVEETTFERFEIEDIKGWDILWRTQENTCRFFDIYGMEYVRNPVEFNQVVEVLYLYEIQGSWQAEGKALVRLNDKNLAYLEGFGMSTNNNIYIYNKHFVAQNIETLFSYAMSLERAHMIKSAL